MQTKHRPLALLGAVIAVIGIGFSWSLSSNRATALSLRPGDKAMVNQGKQLYQQQCAACHGGNLEGQPNWKTRLDNGRLPAPPHDKTGHTWHHNDELLFKITKLGTAVVAGGGYESDMMAFKDQMNDEEIIAVLSYIKSTWPENIRKRHDQMNGNNRKN